MILSQRYFPAIRSILDPQALLSLIVSDYNIDTPVDCKLWKPSRNDTYLVQTADKAYILRIYPARRVYDLATFRWNLLINNQDETLWQTFLQGYQQKRNMRERDLTAIPLFVVVRDIWIVGQQTSHAGHWGFEFVDDTNRTRRKPLWL